MVKHLLQKLWKDPVWSKVISVGIIVLITLAYNLISAAIAKSSFTIAFYSFWTYKIELRVVALFFVLMLLLYVIANRFKYDSGTLSLDRKLFNTIRYEKNMEDFVLEAKFHGFSGGPVPIKRIETLIDFLSSSEKTDFHFFNPKLEKLKTKVIRDLKALDDTLNKYFFGTNNTDWISIPSEWEYTQPERMQEAKLAIKKQEDIFTKTYQVFIKEGRKLLRV